MKMRLSRQNYASGPFTMVAEYGQETEFNAALPNLLGYLPDLVSFTRTPGISSGHEIITIERKGVGRFRYKLERLA